jgi:hypothetical protein
MTQLQSVRFFKIYERDSNKCLSISIIFPHPIAESFEPQLDYFSESKEAAPTK